MSVELDERQGVLKPQEQLPVLVCAGWLNGPPEADHSARHRLTVVDVWGAWCSQVPQAVTGLKKLHEEYAPRGVRFVSLTMEDQSKVDAFVRDHDVPWPSGYGASVEMINALGAANYDMPVPGYEVKPVIYLATADGRVVWLDNHRRMDHSDEALPVLWFALRKELEARLATATESRTAGGEAQDPIIHTSS